MISVLIPALFSYLGTTLDYFVVLLLIFGIYRGRSSKPIFLGAYIGNIILVAVSLVISDVLKLVPQEWILGLLGFIPIFMGIYGFFSDEDEDQEAAEALEKSKPNHIMLNVIVITIATCGADNMAMYIPFFANIQATYIPAILILFIIVLTIIIVSSYYLTLIPTVHTFFEKFGEATTSIIYIALGLYVLIDSGSISHLISLF